MLITIRNNSKEETKITELSQCINHFENSGYNLTVLNELKDSISNHPAVRENSQEEVEKLMFPIHYFSGLSEFKKTVKSMQNKFQQLIGDTRIMLATKKRSSLGNTFVRNKQLSIVNETSDSQRCNARGCKQCPLTNEMNKVLVNGDMVRVPRHLNCKSKNVIYMWVCKLCKEKDVYFGRTTQECHNRTSGHRGSFDDEKWDKSALSMHARDMHQSSFSLDIFSVSIVRKVSPQQLRREEYRYIDKYQTISLGLNRYKV